MSAIDTLQRRGAVMEWVHEDAMLSWMVDIVEGVDGKTHAGPHPDVPTREDGFALMWAWMPDWKPVLVPA